ncbi:MAG TPA: type I secretion C-terminal target domain-containing protein [Stellaceae bacterium]|nr:type I secretion C-terminal target domain-containing protein [Stellaceae bacterium]
MTDNSSGQSSPSVLTFNDEFNSLSLWNGTSGTWDTTAPYVPLNGSGYSLPSNGEQEWYINSTYAPTASVQPWSVSNGVLTLTAAPASAAIQSLIGGYQYTSGQINTYHSFSQTYGYFEMNAELPAGQGLWPAFWLLPESGAWPPEIDAMEVLGNNTSELYTTVHSTSGTGAEVNDGVGTIVANMSTGFHSYGVDWQPDFITWYFDGIAVFQAATPSDLNQPMYMIANLAVGGYWPGDVNGTTPLPAQMEINYIRAYSGLPASITSAAVPVLAANFILPSDLHDVQLVSASSQAVTGNALGDVIISNDAGSTITGGIGNDTLVAGHGADVLTGGGGSDTFVFPVLPWNSGQITDFHPATDKIDLTGALGAIGYTGSNPIADGYVAFVAVGGSTNVYVDSHNPSNPGLTLITTLDGVSPASLSLQDLLFQSSGTPATPPSSSTPVDTAAANYLVPTDVRDVTLTGTMAQTVTGNSLGDTITSNDYGSTLIGGTGNDTLIAGHGADTLTGGAGADSFVFDYLPWNAGQITDFTLGTDKLDFSALLSAAGYTGSDPVADGYVSFASNGGGGTEVYFHSHSASDPWPTLITTLDNVSPAGLTTANVFGEASSSNPPPPPPPTPTVVDTSAPTYTVPAGVQDVQLTGSAAQTITANSLGDTITSNDYGSTLIGGSGNDTLIAGHGADTLTGGAGADSFVFDYLPWNAGQITDFTPGTDKIDISALLSAAGYTGSDPVAGDYVSFASNGSGGTEVYFNAHSASDPWPTLITTLDNVAPSGLTAANVFGGAGSSPNPPPPPTPSVVDTSAPSYTVPAGVQDVQLTGSAAQTVTANALGDTITSNDYASTLIGGSGNDTLIAGQGADTMTGGAGADTFVFNALPWNAGHITDFTPGTDRLDISSLLSDSGFTGSDPVADGYVSFASNGSGGTEVYVNSHSASDPWPTLITTLDNVSPAGLTTTNVFGESDSAANYALPSGVQDVQLTGTAAQTVTGNSLNDLIVSNNYGSTLIAGSGNDTLIAGQGADILTGGAGSDTFVFNSLPWNAGQITNFNPASDVLDLRALFTAAGYHGANPVQDGYLSLASDGAGDTKVYFNAHNPSDPWPTLITTLDHVSPASVSAKDYLFH